LPGASRAAARNGAARGPSWRTALAGAVIADVGDRPLLEQALYLDTHLFLPDGLLICADKMSMAASLEQRVPFLDVELMRFVEQIPARERVGPRAGKRLHRKAMEQLVPRAIVERPKHGFSTPYESWLRESLGVEVERRYAAGAPAAELVDPGTVAGLVAAHRSGRADHKRILYCLLELSQWHDVFILGTPAATSVEAS
jgi:asparagine synthase (glutamine-hydrolysing)